MNCMSCGTTENLSIKYRTKGTLTPRYICKTCRNNSYIPNPSNQRSKTKREKDQDQQEAWYKKAKENQEKLSRRPVWTH